MPELPDLTVYREALERRIVGRELLAVTIASPFLLRTVDPPLAEAGGRRVAGIERLGKRLILALEGDLFLVVHLMIAGRLRWLAREARGPGRITLARLDFPDGRLVLTEAGSKRRASLHLFRGRAAVAQIDRGGLEPLEISLEEFAARVRLESHTIKRALTDPRLFSGIGNAYSDEILHAARLSPMTLTRRLDDEEMARLYHAVRNTLEAWIVRLRAETGDGFPEGVTAFREGMAVHGRYGQPCPDCGSPVQRIRYADNETTYCARCQTGGRLLADRALSRLLRSDWPRTLEELE
ncbi:MAG: Fpg/Nei family DNA glycosylase [Gemmatimonadales bacterium]